MNDYGLLVAFGVTVWSLVWFALGACFGRMDLREEQRAAEDRDP